MVLIIIIRNREKGNVIEISQLCFGYKNSCNVLDEVSLRIRKGEFVCVVGEVCSGKTTLLDCISGQLSHFQGQ